MWVFPWIKLFLHSCSMWHTLEWFNRFCHFLCKRLSSFNQKGFCDSYSCSCSLCEGRTSFCTELIYIKPCRSLFMFSTGFTSFSILLLFSLSFTFFVSLCMVFDFIWLNIPSADAYIFGDFDVHHKDWLTLVKLIDLVNSVIIFLSQVTLLRWLTFLLGSLTVTFTILPFWISFFWCQYFGKSGWSCCFLNFHWLSVKLKRGFSFHYIAYNYSCADWNGFCDDLREFHGGIYLKFVLLLLLVILLSWFRLELLYISILNSRWCLTHLHGFQLLVLLP